MAQLSTPDVPHQSPHQPANLQSTTASTKAQSALHSMPELHLSTRGREAPVGVWWWIVGGREAPVRVWPWQVSIHIQSRHHCGGTILNSQQPHITSSNTVSNLTPGIFSHTLVLSAPGIHSQTRSIHQIKMHENFEAATFNNDVALLHLRSPLHSDHVQHLCTINNVTAGGLHCYSEDEERFFVVGVTSFGDMCVLPQRPGVYTWTSKFTTWLTVIIKCLIIKNHSG
ncbi:LOW QUALITY PROTEIN: transmembrane protease serine 11D-like [Diretmus argenteus]